MIKDNYKFDPEELEFVKTALDTLQDILGEFTPNEKRLYNSVLKKLEHNKTEYDDHHS